MKAQKKIRKNLGTPQRKKPRGVFWNPIIVATLTVGVAIIGIGSLAIATNYEGSIELNFGPDGGQLRINQ